MKQLPYKFSVEDGKIAKMFNVINGLSEKSLLGFHHLKWYPEDREEIKKDYEKFIKLS